MVIYVVDASAVIRYLDGEEGASQMSLFLEERFAGRARLVMTSVQWGEVAGILYKREGLSRMQDDLSALKAAGLEVVPASGDMAVQAALLKRRLKLPHADSFGIALTQELTGAIFVTADYDFKNVDHLVAIEFIGPKPEIPSQPHRSPNP